MFANRCLYELFLQKSLHILFMSGMKDQSIKWKNSCHENLFRNLIQKDLACVFTQHTYVHLYN